MNVLDLFSGIGGFSLGLERAGMRTVAFCEIEPFCRAVLKKHWPDIPIYEDVRTLTAERLRADGISVDVICGGFPCQDISFAGKGAGIEGERSGLWKEYARLIGEIRPRYVIVENVSALLGRGLDVVLGDLASLGFDAEWHCIPASAVGAPHRRDRIWIVAYPEGERFGEAGEHRERQAQWPAGRSEILANPQSVGCGTRWARRPDCGGARLRQSALPNANGEQTLGAAISRSQLPAWNAEPAVGRVVDGLSYELVRPELQALGNAVVPQIPEIIGRAILAAEAA